MKHISLFSGIGGDTLAAQWAGFETVLFVETDKFCQKVLNKHWPDVPIIGDIKDATKEKVMAYTEHNGRAKTKNQREYSQNQCEGKTGQNVCVNESQGTCSTRRIARGDDCSRREGISTVNPITLITGGFPCQPVSVAGKQRGKEDDRWLWPEMLRVISEIRPTWVVAENVAGLLRMGFRDCISDLESAGYETTSFLIPACAVNAPHRRDRVFIVGYSNRERELQPQRAIRDIRGRIGNNGQDVADTDRQGLQGHRGLRECGGQWLTWKGGEPLEGIWESEPPVGRVASGISQRVDRLKALGNAIVPQQIYPILKAIADIESRRR